MSEVKIKDMDEDVRTLQLALSAVGIHFKYQDACLVYNVLQVIQEQGDEATIGHIKCVQREVEYFWDDYENKANDEG